MRAGLCAMQRRRYLPPRKRGRVDWAAIKTVITYETGLSRDALHVLAGVGAYLLLVAILPRRASRWLAWLLVLAAAVANEWADYLHETWPGQWVETTKDMITTMMVPTVLVLLGSFAPHLLVRAPADPEDEPEVDPEP